MPTAYTMQVTMPYALFNKTAAAVVSALAGAPEELLRDGAGLETKLRLMQQVQAEPTILDLTAGQYILLSAAVDVACSDDDEFTDAEYEAIQGALESRRGFFTLP